MNQNTTQPPENVDPIIVAQKQQYTYENQPYSLQVQQPVVIVKQEPADNSAIYAILG